ncbi:ABC transporter permease [Metabacillus fastidiosus]|uniref:FtsX-like permease family protein n=1 Tax=Metabacillus fastidiosus TaxID=1458 RepID=A0ABU6NX99_9BACI|nr:FtsX-like permease family protein [Metabacillus fastidiosus]MED4401263.1 FtsX-like permease family protein [Metabacillus fastidiosus]MED4464190.1 FtsX-like permease family protein [Metabacillus fastidiosus]
MKFKDQLKFLRRNMKKNRLRVFMTILATTMGCAFLIVLASVGFGIHKSITDQFLSQQIITEINIHGKEDSKVTDSDIEKIKGMNDVKAVVKRDYVEAAIEASLDDRTSYNTMTITDMEEELKANLKLEKGEIPKNKNEIIVGYDFAKQLLTKKEQEDVEKAAEQPDEQVKEPKGYEGDLIGKTVNIKVTETDDKGEVKNEKKYDLKIVGIGKAPSRDWVIDNQIYVSDHFKEEFKSFINEENSSISAYASNFEKVASVTQALKDQKYQVYSVTEELDQVNLFFNVFKAGLIFVGTVAVLIASIGIFNTMTMAVTERTQEIGIMKALGAEPGTIRKMFLMESAYIGILGSIIGIVISYAISWISNLVLPVILASATGTEDAGAIDFTFSYIPLSLVVIAAVISIGVAMVSGVRPAIKATNINVLAALRREL